MIYFVVGLSLVVFALAYRYFSLVAFSNGLAEGLAFARADTLKLRADVDAFRKKYEAESEAADEELELIVGNANEAAMQVAELEGTVAGLIRQIAALTAKPQPEPVDLETSIQSLSITASL